MQRLLLSLVCSLLFAQMMNAQIAFTSGAVSCTQGGICVGSTCTNTPAASDGDPFTAATVTTVLGVACSNTLTANFAAEQAVGLFGGFYVTAADLLTLMTSVTITLRNTVTLQTQQASGASLLTLLGNGNGFVQLQSTIAFNQIDLTLGSIVTGAQSIQIFTGFSSTAQQAVPLAVTWLGFTAKEQRGQVMLEWSTANEENSDYFAIERSTDGINYSEIGRVKAAGNSSYISNYQFMDQLPVSRAENYYRLRQADFDGRYQYSLTRYVTMSGNGRSITITPNPATSYILINGNLNKMRVRVFDFYGKQIIERNLSGSQAKLDISSISTGTYLLIIDDNNRMLERQKIIVTK